MQTPASARRPSSGRNPGQLLLVATLFAFAAGSSLGSAQAVLSPGWEAFAGPIDALTVTLDHGAPDTCVGNGIIVGHDDKQVYVLTTARLALDTQGTTPRENLHVATSLGGEPTARRRVAARVLSHDAALEMDLAVLGIADARLAKSAASARFDVLGDSSGAIPREQSYVVGCTDNAITKSSPRPLLQVRPATIAFHGVELRPTMAGGPLVHLLGTQPTIVGLTVVARPRAEARSVSAVLERLRGWGVPTMLRPHGSAPNCVYKVQADRKSAPSAGVPLWILASSRDSFTINVDTAPGCSWVAYADASTWMRVTAPDSAATPATGRGPGSATLTVAQSNMCDARFRRGAIYVAGQILQIGQDGTNLGKCH